MVEFHSSDFTVPAVDASAVIIVDATAGPITITFEHRHNAVYSAWIKKVDPSANIVTLLAPPNHTFEGASTIQLKKQYDFANILHCYTTFYLLSVPK